MKTSAEQALELARRLAGDFSDGDKVRREIYNMEAECEQQKEAE